MAVSRGARSVGGRQNATEKRLTKAGTGSRSYRPSPTTRGTDQHSTSLRRPALLMELSCFMKKMNIRTFVEWAPREANKEADSLANGVFDGFSSSLGFRSIPAASSGRSCRRP